MNVHAVDSAREVGVLALQGASTAHVETLARCGWAAREVRAPRDLEGLTHLVLPGGESTTLAHLMALFGLDDAIRTAFHAGDLALLGTCAGAILLARRAPGGPPTLDLLDAEIERNAYGTQVDSFSAAVDVEPGALDGPPTLPAFFIRAPRLGTLGPEVHVLARRCGDPVAITAPGILATTFHPELGLDDRLHRRFLESVPRPATSRSA
jgi:5'-phosphate synthase pdxT subunit